LLRKCKGVLARLESSPYFFEYFVGHEQDDVVLLVEKRPITWTIGSHSGTSGTYSGEAS